MASNPGRRSFIRKAAALTGGTFAAAGAARAAPLPVPSTNREPGRIIDEAAYGMPSKFEARVKRRRSDVLKNRHECVTHGDYTPKNFLVAGDTLILLDYEVVHVGWPEFDVASIVNHLTLKFIHLANPALLETARRFLGGHKLHLPLLGALMLARVDGKSPAEYIREEDKSRIRVMAKQLLSGAFESYEQFIADALLGKRGASSVGL